MGALFLDFYFLFGHLGFVAWILATCDLRLTKESLSNLGTVLIASLAFGVVWESLLF